MHDLEIRTAKLEDLPAILRVYAHARAFMAEQGNGTQWGTTNPKEEQLIEDILNAQLYVVQASGRICGVFAFIIGPDPTYTKIDGKWRYDDAYGTIHRIAGDGTVQGILARCLEYCRLQSDHLRIDTHENNRIMQHLIKKNGFQYCGIIYIQDGSPRLAYDWHK